jgi:hypothetical protein
MHCISTVQQVRKLPQASVINLKFGAGVVMTEIVRLDLDEL